MKTNLPRKTIAVTGNYRQDSYVILSAQQVGYDLYISKRQARRAERELRLPTGDYLVLCQERIPLDGYRLWIDF